MEQSKSTFSVVQEFDNLYVLVRGTRYANALIEAKQAFQAQDFVKTLRLVRDTGELHRCTHLHLIQQDPEKAGGKKEAQIILEKQAKIKDTLDRFDKLVERLEKMAKLTPAKPNTPVSAIPQRSAKDTPANSEEDVMDQRKGPAVSIIDTGSFTQLQMSAQQTGLVPNADAIGFVRDHEFRTGEYQQAFNRIDGIFMHLRTAAEQRAQRLRQEDLNYHSGVLKMSPKQWMIKQQRDTAETQIIDRTLRYFARVLDGLRILMNPSHDDSPQGEQKS